LRQFDLILLGWGPDFEGPFEPHAAAGLAAGRVGARHRGGVVLFSELGELLGMLAGRLHNMPAADLPTAGDWVAFRPLDDGQALVEAVLPRRTAFRRGRGDLARASRVSEEQVVAANVDVVLIVSDLSLPPNPRSLERYLAAAWDSGAEPVVVLTKADVCPDLAGHAAEVERVAIGVPLLAVSAATGEGVEDVRALVAGNHTAALLGPSGTGKSTLVNRLLGRDVQATQAVRSDGRGRHTTTVRELFPLPDGGLILDTPGLRVLQPWNADGLGEAFSDVEELARACRFSDCRHDTEPGCAIRAAIAEGRLAAERYESFERLEREVAWLQRKEDPRAQAEQRRRWRVMHREHRARDGVR
jgi:ribosome biogenesis GTPase